jgi:SAM-dependent methyltransferase
MRGNEDALFARRAGSFGMHAAAYAEHRPDYPVAGIRWALAGAAHEPHRVLDLAAGTGKLTEGLLTMGLEVTAVEPDGDMLAELSRRLPGVSAHDGSAERIPLADSSVDAVLVGQAFHWFDAGPALAEIARVLRPGGVVGALWNHEDVRVEWIAELAQLASTGASRGFTYGGDFPAPQVFEPFERTTFAHSHLRTADSLTATIGTHSHTLVISQAERAEVLDRVRRFLAGRPETAHGEFEVPLRTTVLRARVRSADVALEDQA